MRFVVGIDAGGTKTVALLADASGRVLGEARGGGANLQTHGELAVEKTLHDVLERASGGRPVSALCVGMAGVDRAGDEAVMGALLRRLGYREAVRVVNDALVALVAGSPERFGIAVVAGTGSICFGADRAGRTARAGGEGYLLADEGSAQWLGREALRVAVRAGDGRGPDTALLALALEAFDVASLPALVAAVYARGGRRPDEIAALAPIVEAAHGRGDPLAGALLDTAADELALAARAVFRQLRFEGRVPVVLAGGAFRACPSLVPRLAARLDVPAADVVRLTAEAATGAVALACDLLPRP
jgi:N-acetylglucosamine kinase-like BadF-type ATPase